MKILYHHRTASKDGQAVHIEEMIAALRAQGCEVIVVEPPALSAADFGRTAAHANALRRWIPKPLAEMLELSYTLVAYRRLRRAVEQHRPDVLYERHNLYLLAGRWIKRRYGLPYLLEVNAPLALERHQHDGLAFPRLARRLEASVWRSADIVLPVSAVLGRIIEAEGVDPRRIVVIPNGINLEAFGATVPSDEAKRRLGLAGRVVLGFTGFVRPWHGLEQVIDFIAETRRADLFLLVVGDGPARSALAAHAERRGVAGQVRFTGVVSRAAVPAMVAAFDVALQPAATPYASPLKLFEYLALGRAIVAPNQPNLAEILEDGKNGLLFDPAQPGDLARALSRLVNDAALRERLGRAARETILLKGLTWRQNAQRVIALAEQLRRKRIAASEASAPPRVA
ncbi:MAG: glycosyltransferase family 4 protein [Sutterellaceae bacterium]|nr:glycosyltransferase family 4 protein [Burkholderiaceae bacterium]MCX7901666.1 glycosyltransferase family 4 protein [Burkholderiaceae bacterium]MDW8430302.1 glycosyltransferase family 4 protein [Sutterellaceae bacterium]